MNALGIVLHHFLTAAINRSAPGESCHLWRAKVKWPSTGPAAADFSADLCLHGDRLQQQGGGSRRAVGAPHV